MATADRQGKYLVAMTCVLFAGTVIYPVATSLHALNQAPTGTIPLLALFRIALFFYWFHLLGYWYFRFRSWGANPSPCEFVATSKPTVSVLVPIRNEPELLIKRMLQHLASVTYAELHVVLIDNSTESHVEYFRELAAVAGLHRVDVLRKPDTRGFKGGALNLALDQGQIANSRYVLVLDVDHAPDPCILDQLVPVLESNPRLAFVQAPQVYAAPVDSIVARAFMFKQRIFYNQICPGLAAAGCLFMSGSNVLVRTSALQAVGGFDTQSLTEDLRTSFELHCRGWKGTYVPVPVATGLPPLSFSAYQIQLKRWAMGTFQNLGFALASFLRDPFRLDTAQWLFFLGWNGLFYLQGLVVYLLFVVCFLLIAVDALPAPSGVDGMLLLLTLATLTSTAIHEHRSSGATFWSIMRSKAVFFSDFAVMVAALAQLLCSSRIVFQVTPKSMSSAARPRVFIVLHALFCVFGACSGAGILLFRPDNSPALVFWLGVLAVLSGSASLLMLREQYAQIS